MMDFQAKMVPFKCSAHCQAENWHRIALSMGRAVMGESQVLRQDLMEKLISECQT
jgi:uncharacterized protein YuzB (UPF0349 family)